MTAQRPEHESDGWGGVVHVDIDPQIPTGICAICSWEPPYEPEPETPMEEDLPYESEPTEDPEETPEPETVEP